MDALRVYIESEMASEENQSTTAIKHTWILPSNTSLHHHRRSCRSGRESHRQPLPKFRDVAADLGVSTRERRKSLQVRDWRLVLKNLAEHHVKDCRGACICCRPKYSS